MRKITLPFDLSFLGAYRVSSITWQHHLHCVLGEELLNLANDGAVALRPFVCARRRPVAHDLADGGLNLLDVRHKHGVAKALVLDLK